MKRLKSTYLSHPRGTHGAAHTGLLAGASLALLSVSMLSWVERLLVQAWVFALQLCDPALWYGLLGIPTSL